MNIETKLKAISFIEDSLGILQPVVAEDAFREVKHYLDCDEYEMAFEGLFIELMQLKELPPIDLVKSRQIALLLGLDKESVFKSDFWISFERFIRTATNSTHL
jgi:hypothetical protein